MDQAKKERLQKKGWVVGDVDEFLDLNPAEMAIAQKQVNLVMQKWNMRMRVYRLS